MTMNEPGRNPPRYENDRNRDRTDYTWAWVIGAIAALAVLGGIYYGMSNRGNETATTTPTTTTGAGPTAGQGANQPTTPPAQPAPANR